MRSVWVITMAGQRGKGIDGTSDFITRGKINSVCVSQISAWDPVALLGSSFRTYSV